MTASDHPNCGIDDIIEHSLKLHPQLLADCLRSHACVHAQFADAYDNREVTLSELGLADRLRRFAGAVERGDCTIPDDPDIRREAFSCAAGLQDLHPIMQSVIAEHENARNARSGEGGCLVQQDDSADRDTRCEGRITTAGSWPFVERRRPGRANYMNRDLIALLRGQTAKKDDGSGERDAAVNSGSAWPPMIRTTYDPEADVLDIQFGPAEAISDGHQEVAPGVYVEFDASGNPIGVEITSVRLRQTAPAASEAAAE
jgi:uncharacterized protein YuzE